ncbi:MAG: NADH-quinone oxidoreductase subunit C [Candidatus Marsarchaeota archaeon]|nr:NADH-quinone oxidoreductase subunit C [Candidatus Marsarchaeota archaeon]
METTKEALVKTCAELKQEGYDYLNAITAVDYTDHLEAVYILYNTEKKSESVITVMLPINDLELSTISNMYAGAVWYEREMQEMFGIKITGANQERLLLEEWNGADYPLRKEFIWGKDYKKKT